jgi:hypothetical protein
MLPPAMMRFNGDGDRQIREPELVSVQMDGDLVD